MNKRVLIIEDDEDISMIERDFLEMEGYEVSIVREGTKGYQEAVNGDYQLILLDVMLPGMDGYEICRGIRDKVDIPIIMVTAKTEELDKLRGLGLGADDYISKPFSPTELVARVKANIAQYERIKGRQASPEPKVEGEIHLGKIRINSQTHRVYVDDVEVDCKHREYELLLFLMSNAEIVFSKEQLYEKIWGMDALGNIRTVAVHINRLREKVEEDPTNPQYIQTVWGAGYRFQP
ncbi:DNA-binding response regulator [Enterococcus sp. JM4C]|uniref:response regulator transcription factor n=1 Tax=Candidatus Enterococcus huntleyi TaxID=1857217 RepID=UPI001379F564|nr:response regulator transcription factor [Enterococcus sp. JM4C]KAF1298172.1 DNA-binding response regulator [Enterococcus sp. JM4C]